MRTTLALAAVLALFVAPDPVTVTFRGTVELASIDEHGDVAGVGIWDDEAQLYYDVDLKLGRGAELRAHVGRRLEGDGTVSRDAEDVRRLVVTSYTLLPDPPDRPDRPPGER